MYAIGEHNKFQEGVCLRERRGGGREREIGSLYVGISNTKEGCHTSSHAYPADLYRRPGKSFGTHQELSFCVGSSVKCGSISNPHAYS